MSSQLNTWQTILAVVLAALSMMAIAVCLYAVIFGGRLDVALVAAVILLAVAQLAALFHRASAKRDDFANTKDLMRANDSLSNEQSLQRRRLDRMEASLASGHNAAAEQLDAQVRALEHSLSALSGHRQTGEPPPAAMPKPVMDTASPPSEVDLYLEPVVRLADRRTAYYRASLGVHNGNGEAVPVSKITREAERAGYLGELDLAIFERAVPVIRRFQQKRRDISVLCPVSGSSFADGKFMRSLLALLDRNRDVASALVIEVTQATLSQLTDKGQEGLAYLAQLGATFSLSNVRPDVPDLTTLSEVGFAFICVDVRLLVALKNEGQARYGSLLDEARRANLQLIAADIVNPSEYAWMEDTVQLAYGPYFSPPRLVRHDITVEEERAKVA